MKSCNCKTATLIALMQKVFVIRKYHEIAFPEVVIDVNNVLFNEGLLNHKETTH